MTNPYSSTTLYYLHQLIGQYAVRVQGVDGDFSYCSEPNLISQDKWGSLYATDKDMRFKISERFHDRAWKIVKASDIQSCREHGNKLRTAYEHSVREANSPENRALTDYFSLMLAKHKIKTSFESAGIEFTIENVTKIMVLIKILYSISIPNVKA